MALTDPLSRRERQIMDVLYRQGEATANEVLAALPDPPSSSAIRTLLRILVGKGHARQRQDGVRYVYFPANAPQSAGQHALTHVVETFFGGSVERVVAALVNESDGRLSEAELDRMTELIRHAREQEANR